jgi:hypothetical protein
MRCVPVGYPLRVARQSRTACFRTITSFADKKRCSSFPKESIVIIRIHLILLSRVQAFLNFDNADSKLARLSQ